MSETVEFCLFWNSIADWVRKLDKCKFLEKKEFLLFLSKSLSTGEDGQCWCQLGLAG